MNWCSTFRAERLWPSIPAFAGLDVDFQFTRKQLERIFPSVRDHSERGTRQRLAVGAMADQGLGRVDLRLVGNVSALQTPIDFHLISSAPCAVPAERSGFASDQI